MGREVRRVPADWQHPKDERGNFIPLSKGSSYREAVKDWDDGCVAWNRGDFPQYATEDDRGMSFEDWAGPRPSITEYMPQWAESEATHFMMYEDTSEGTPISPAFETPELLARWLADNGASAFGRSTASYEAWLSVVNRGWVPSAVYMPKTGLVSGVEAAIHK